MPAECLLDNYTFKALITFRRVFAFINMCAIGLNFCVQVNESLVPYTVSVHICTLTILKTQQASPTSSITCNEKRFQRDKKELLTQFRDEPEMMKIACGRVSRLLCSYFTTTRGYSGDILNAFFFTPRGTRTEFPAEKIEGRLPKMTNMGYLISSPSRTLKTFSRRRSMALRSNSSAQN